MNTIEQLKKMDKNFGETDDAANCLIFSKQFEINEYLDNVYKEDIFLMYEDEVLCSDQDSEHTAIESVLYVNRDNGLPEMAYWYLKDTREQSVVGEDNEDDPEAVLDFWLNN